MKFWAWGIGILVFVVFVLVAWPVHDATEEQPGTGTRLGTVLGALSFSTLVWWVVIWWALHGTKIMNDAVKSIMGN